ncbi:MAG: hypothetical protein V3V20_08545 [Algisphaera sp.]
MARKLCSTLAVTLLAGAMLVGCNATRGNLTPELHSYSRSLEQDQNLHARVIDNNTRMIWDDLDRVLLLDKTSRLSPYPVP